MQYKVYANYSEKFVKNVILYAEKDNGELFYDEDATQKVYEDSLTNLFLKGLIVSFNETLYVPFLMKKNALTEQTEIKAYNGTTMYTFVAAENEEEEEEEDVSGTELAPSAPTFDDETGIITIPSKEGVIYKIGEDELDPGEQDPIEKDTDVTVVAIPDEGYYFTTGVTDEWTFNWSAD